MKIHADERQVLKGGVSDETTFKIKATGKAFQILSSGLYSNKILAIIRELSCNASDAHVAAGKKDVPIEIHLPTSLKPTFYVKDFGTGLDHDGIMNLYTTYFESTKQDSNDYIGALGLGSKSPFSYVNNFMVESRFNGMKRTYTAFINEQGLPSITLMNTESTNESNGLTVSMAVKNDDISKFHNEAKKALMYFNPIPNVKGSTDFKTYKLTHTLSGSNWKIRESEYSSHMEGAYVIQGFVPYPIDDEQMRQHKISEIANSLLGVNLDITVPIGDVEVAASREALSYIPQTITNLVSSLETVAKEIRASIQKEFDKCTTLWEATKLYCLYDNSSTFGYSFYALFSSLNRNKHFTWKGEELSHSIDVPYENIKVTMGIRATIIDSRRSHGKKFKIEGKLNPKQLNASTIKQHDYDGEKLFNVHPTKNTIVFVDDVVRNGNFIIFNYITTNFPNEREMDAIILRPTSKDEFDQAEIDFIIKNLGNPPYAVVSTLPKPVLDGTEKVIKRRDISERLLWRGFENEKGRYSRNKVRRVFSRLCWATTTVDLTEGGFYVPIKRFSIMDDNKEMEYFDMLLESAGEMKLIDANECIYGFNEKEMESIKGNKKWVNAIDYMKKKFVKLNENDELIKLISIKDVVEEIGQSFYDNFIKKNDDCQKELEKCSFSEVLNEMATMYQNAKKLDIKPATIRNFLTGTGEGDLLNKAVSETNALKAKWENTIAEYRMLDLVDWRYMGKEQVSMVLEYVNLVVKDKKK